MLHPRSVRFTITPGIYSTRFMPDIYFAAKGVGGIWLETKRDEKHEASHGQAATIRRLNYNDATAYVVQTWEQWLKIKEEHGI